MSLRNNRGGRSSSSEGSTKGTRASADHDVQQAIRLAAFNILPGNIVNCRYVLESKVPVPAVVSCPLRLIGVIPKLNVHYSLPRTVAIITEP
jgi:hypothetical protein